MAKVSNSSPLYNTPVESGLRLLFLLEAVKPQKCDLQRIVIYDYILVHSGDINGAPQSLHPPTPFLSGELLVRRNIVSRSLSFVQSKGLIEKDFSSDGVSYHASELTGVFLNYMECSYAEKCREISQWIASQFKNYSDEDLAGFTKERWGESNIDFEYGSVVWEDSE